MPWNCWCCAADQSLLGDIYHFHEQGREVEPWKRDKRSGWRWPWSRWVAGGNREGPGPLHPSLLDAQHVLILISHLRSSRGGFSAGWGLEEVFKHHLE